MKCPKCNYTSFDYLETCKRCGTELRDVKSLLQIIAVSPEDQAPSAPAMEMLDDEPLDKMARPADDSFADMQPLGEDEEILDGLDFDGSFDDMVVSHRAPEAEAAGFPEEESLVEHTSYAEQAAATTRKSPPPPKAEDDDELLDLDFGDLFEEKR